MNSSTHIQHNVHDDDDDEEEQHENLSWLDWIILITFANILVVSFQFAIVYLFLQFNLHATNPNNDTILS